MGDDGAGGGTRTFEIGLVMAGAISAGAYTAGVIDFLIQALDEWQRAKDGQDPDCPRHNVTLRILAGASAGGMTAALAAAQLGQDFTPVTGPSPAGPMNNKFYESWVERIDIERLLGTQDLDADPDGDVRSALDSTVLDEIAAAAFRFPAGSSPVARKYVADPLHVLLTLTNLRGVPFKVIFRGDPDDLPQMLMAGDSMHFAVGDPTGLPSDVHPLPPDRFEDPAWGTLTVAALATGAFPVGLAPRELSRLASEYNSRTWPATEPIQANGTIVGCGLFKNFPPTFPDAIRNNPGFRYDFLCIDGGTVDNEPLELARRILDGEGPGFFNPRSRGDQAENALIAIAPFPNLGTYPVQEPPVGNPFLLQVLSRTLYSAINQMRFDPAQALLAADPEAYNRYLIAPERAPVLDARVQSWIASGSLGGFGGFLSRAFREHDFQLGRRNAQHFLQSVFALPDQEGNRNPLFDVGWTEAARGRFRIVEGPDSQDRPRGAEPGPGDRVYLPIIPVMNAAAAPVGLPDWPTYSQDQLATLRGQVETRLGAVVDRLIGRNVSPLPSRVALEGAFRLFRGHLVDKILQNIAGDLRDRGLLV